MSREAHADHLWSMHDANTPSSTRLSPVPVIPLTYMMDTGMLKWFVLSTGRANKLPTRQLAETFSATEEDMLLAYVQKRASEFADKQNALGKVRDVSHYRQIRRKYIDLWFKVRVEEGASNKIMEVPNVT